MNHGSMSDVRDRLAQDLMRDGGRIALAQKKKAEDIHYRISLFPLEVDVRHLAGDSLDLDQHCRDGIRYHGASCMKHAMPSNPLRLHGEALIEL